MSRTSLYRVSLCRGLRYIGVRYTEDFVIQGFVTSRSYHTKFNLVSIKRGGCFCSTTNATETANFNLRSEQMG